MSILKQNDELRKHHERMREIKSSIDTSAPVSSKLKHMQKNAKAQTFAKERAREIERNNGHLVTRMLGIMEGGAGYTPLIKPETANLPSFTSLTARVRNDELRRIQEVRPHT